MAGRKRDSDCVGTLAGERIMERQEIEERQAA